MAYRHKSRYQIISAYSDEEYLAITESAVVARRESTLSQDKNGQVWLLILHEGYARLHPVADTGCAISICQDDYSCHTVNWKHDCENTKLDLITVNRAQNLYRIKTYSKNIPGELFLTMPLHTEGDKLTWAPDAPEYKGQIWELREEVDVTANGQGSMRKEHILSMPVNVNQHNSQYPKEIQHSGCALCCGVDVSSYYGASVHNTVPYFYSQYWSSAGYNWLSPNAILTEARMNGTSNILRKSKAEIDAGHPIILHATGNGTQHWVVAYGYVNQAQTAADLLVLDPYGDNYVTPDGGFRTLDAAMRRACKQGYQLSGRTKTTRSK